jgi:hypothetical protein
MTIATRKIQADLSAPSEIVTTFVKSQYNASQYKTRLDPVVLMAPHSDGVAGKDIVVIAKDQNFGPTYVSRYKTALREVHVFTKDQLSLSMPVQIAIASGNNLNTPGSPVNPTTEDNKIKVTDLISTTINPITLGLTLNTMNMKTYSCCPTDATNSTVWSYLEDSVINVGGVLDTATGRHIVYDATNASLHIVYVKKNVTTSLNQIWHAYSLDGGKTWISELVSGTSTKDQFQPQIVIDNNRTLHFVWVECFSVYEKPPHMAGSDTYYIYDLLYCNKSSSASWSPAVIISRDPGTYPFRTGYQNHPSLQVKNDGLSLGVAWMGHGCCHALANIYVSILYIERDTSGTWSSRENAYELTDGSCAWSVSLDYDLGGSPHVIFCTDNDGGSPHYPTYHIVKSSGSWAAPELVSDGALPTLATSNCVIDLDNTIHVLLISSSGYTAPADLWYARKVLGGSWVRSRLLASLTFIRAGLQVDSSRNFYVYCTKWNGAHYDGYAAKFSYDLVKLSEHLYNADNRDVASVCVPWSRLPLSGSVFQHLSQQDNCIVFARATNGPWTTGDIVFTSDSTSVIGSVPIIPSYESYNTKIRGVISKSKLNPPLICPAVIH